MQKSEKIVLCGVARAFVQISENGPRSNKFGHPCSRQRESKQPQAPIPFVLVL